MTISIIIPTQNEASTIEQVVADAFRYAHKQQQSDVAIEVIVVDSGSTDATVALASQAGANVLPSPKPGRAAQMNYGASQATGDVFYFVHADVQLNPDYTADIAHALSEGYEAGRYRFRFDSDKTLLRFNSYGTRFGGLMSRGGDQTLFITRHLFEQIDGFDEHYVIMEDFDMIRRIEQQGKFIIIPKNVVVSARKYEANSWVRVQLANLTAVLLFACNVPPTRIARTYRTLLKK